MTPLPRSRVCLFLTGLALVLLTSTPSARAVTLTWDEAWRLAQAQNSSVMNSREQLITARAQVNEARSGALPSLTASGAYTRNLESPVFFISGQPIRIGLENEYAGQIELTQPIWVAGKVGGALRAARHYVRQSEAGVNGSLQNVRVEVAQAFFGAILARELVTTSETSLARAIQHRDQTKLMYEEGLVSEYDKIRADVQVANLEPGVLQARNGYALAKENLRRLLKLTSTDSVEVVGSLEPPDTTLPDVSAERAFAQRSEMTSLTEGREVQRELLGITRRSLYLPSVYAALNYSVMSQADKFELDNLEWVKSSAAMLQVQIPLFDGFRTPAKVAQYRASLRQLDYAEADLRNIIRMDVDQSRRELERAIRTVAVQEENVREAQRGYEIAKVRYESGLGTQLELLDAELQLDHARVNRLQALYDTRIARMQLERAMGTPLEQTNR